MQKKCFYVTRIEVGMEPDESMSIGIWNRYGETGRINTEERVVERNLSGGVCIVDRWMNVLEKGRRKTERDEEWERDLRIGNYGSTRGQLPPLYPLP